MNIICAKTKLFTSMRVSVCYELVVKVLSLETYTKLITTEGSLVWPVMEFSWTHNTTTKQMMIIKQIQ